MAVILDKKRKIYIAVVGLGFGALVVDRFFLDQGPGPAAASAKVTGAAAVAGDEGASITAKPSVTGGNSATGAAADTASLAGLADTLESLAQQHSWEADRISDAFVPPTAWAPRLHATVSTNVSATSPAPGSDAQARAQVEPPTLANGDRFVRDHHVTALMAGSGSSIAVVDGQTVRLGAVVDGFRLVDVRQRSTIWERGATRVELALEAGLDAVPKGGAGRGSTGR